MRPLNFGSWQEQRAHTTCARMCLAARSHDVCAHVPMYKVGGARRDRTDDLLLAKQALSQLSYGPG